MLATLINNTLYGYKNWRLAEANAHGIQPDSPEQECTGRMLMTSTNPRCWRKGELRTSMKTCAPACDSTIRSDYGWMLMHLSSPHGIEMVQHWEFAELNEWQLSCKGSYWVCYWSSRVMNLHMGYICQKNTRIFTIVYGIRKLQLS